MKIKFKITSKFWIKFFQQYHAILIFSATTSNTIKKIINIIISSA